ncbi:uncharacterized protein LY89DRAFT_685413 [Mollisia scopiformis]|uniref:Uncharacterized protein n=1 Tax=Mollisia scopiformis TaxID=149040 RepID=A0A194X9I5_MOLSC|nr:uncharacterized protein LY89DRAFT_685413 [Mollisia scopiformis]KUJ16437.1 hypothetical protein LY89DRAFT_685413 [Mollisia scopiformis]
MSSGSEPSGTQSSYASRFEQPAADQQPSGPDQVADSQLLADSQAWLEAHASNSVGPGVPQGSGSQHPSNSGQLADSQPPADSQRQSEVKPFSKEDTDRLVALSRRQKASEVQERPESQTSTLRERESFVVIESLGELVSLAEQHPKNGLPFRHLVDINKCLNKPSNLLRYHINFVLRRTTTYYPPFGTANNRVRANLKPMEDNLKDLPNPQIDTAWQEARLIAQIERYHQRKIDAPRFLAECIKAGVTDYILFVEGKMIVYMGAKGERYEEHFPDAETPNPETPDPARKRRKTNSNSKCTVN